MIVTTHTRPGLVTSMRVFSPPELVPATTSGREGFVAGHTCWHAVVESSPVNMMAAAARVMSRDEGLKFDVI